MYDTAKIILGLLVFLIVVTFPFWYGVTTGTGAEMPALKLPQESKTCVENKEYMRRLHMDLLNQWRDTVVREGTRIYVSTSGENFEISLTGTCLGCHNSKAEFCDQCHNYVGVSAYCWDCHIEAPNLQVQGK